MTTEEEPFIVELASQCCLILTVVGFVQSEIPKPSSKFQASLRFNCIVCNL
jgi:hypothetical protein